MIHHREFSRGLAYVVAVMAIQVAAAQTAGTFVATGNMGASRSNHSATLLRDGRVLITGGAGASAEIYDPATGKFAPTGSMRDSRGGHAATLLNDGRVLVAGPVSAEIYDPSTGRFAPASSLISLADRSTGNLLGDGRVLIAGDGAVAQLYDPATDTFTAARNAPQDSFGSTVTLLADGTALFTAGFPDAGDIAAVAMLYDPGSSTSRPAGRMVNYPDDLYWHTATLLGNGTVLVAGGSDDGDGVNTLANAQLYDPSTATFQTTGSMRNGRSLHTATLLPGGTVLIAGGGNGNQLSSAELYDRSTGIFVAAGVMTSPRSSQTATLLLDGTVLLTGGNTPKAPFSTNSAELYIPAPSAASSASLAAPLAPESLASVFGARLAPATAAADPQSQPASLGGVNVHVRDSAGTERLAPLLYVSPSQINFEVPAGTAPGSLTLDILNGSNTLSLAAQVRAIAPGLFTLPGNRAAAYATRVEPNGAQTILPVGAPIVLDERPVYLTLFGTGIRGRSSLENVKAMIGGINAPVAYAGPQGAVPGLDQVNLYLPLALKGNSGTSLVLTVDDVAANQVLVDVR